MASARASAPAACFPIARGHGTTMGQRPRRLGLSPFARLWRRGVRGAGRPDFAQAREGYQHRSGGTRLTPLLVLPSAGHRHRLEVDPRGSGRGETPSPRSHRCRRRCRRHHLRWGILVQAPRFAWTLFDAPLTLGGRDSSSFSLSFSESFVDFCFSTDWRRLSRSTSSSFTGRLEDRTSIGPCESKDKLKEGSKKI